MKLLIAAALGLAIAAPAAAKPSTPALAAPIAAFIDAFNKGDVAAAGAPMDASVTIIDEVPPFVWTGPKAFTTWVADLAANDKAAGISDEKVAISPATREVVGGSRAYVIVPAVYTFTQKGTAMREAAQMTFALHKGKAGWKIAGWTWTGPNATPAK